MNWENDFCFVMKNDFHNNSLGKKGENIAANYLKGCGWKIVETSFQTRYGEIDLVAYDENKLVFVEVKTRYTARFGSPQSAVTNEKLHKIIKSAHIYLQTNKKESFRIDVIAILFGRNDHYNIKHIKNVSPY